MGFKRPEVRILSPRRENLGNMKFQGFSYANQPRRKLSGAFCVVEGISGHDQQQRLERKISSAMRMAAMAAAKAMRAAMAGRKVS